MSSSSVAVASVARPLWVDRYAACAAGTGADYWVAGLLSDVVAIWPFDAGATFFTFVPHAAQREPFWMVSSSLQFGQLSGYPASVAGVSCGGAGIFVGVRMTKYRMVVEKMLKPSQYSTKPEMKRWLMTSISTGIM